MQKVTHIYEIIGHKTLVILEEFGNISILAWQSIKSLFRLSFNLKNTFEQMVEMGINSIPVALTTSLFVGMVFAIQIANEFVKFGAGKVVGGVMGIAVARELAPVLTAVVIAGRVGAAIAAEIGTMSVTQQVDALKAMGSSPIKYLVVPRFIAASVMLPVLTIFADIVGFFGGYFVCIYVSKINPVSYMEAAQSFLKTGDIYGGLIKAFVFGMLISIISCYKGLSAKNGAKGVGEGTTSAVVVSLISIFISNYFMSLLLFNR